MIFISGNKIPEKLDKAHWSLLTRHGHVLLSVSQDPDCRLRDIATTTGITERRVHAILDDLVQTGYVVKVKIGRRNRYEISGHLATPDVADRVQAIGEVLKLLGSVEEALPHS